MAKGGDFEWHVARLLTNWMRGGKPGDLQTGRIDTLDLVRSVGSGGWSRRGANQTSDLAANTPLGMRLRQLTVIECKHWKQVDWYWYWTSPANELWKAIERTQEEAREVGTKFMFVIRQNHRPILVGVPFLAELPVMAQRRSMALQDQHLKFCTLDDFMSEPLEFYEQHWGT